ncbi:hypothetical protein [Robbsia sp. KACC 23696]|uniref:hypothetical protein n=1 Tax=Robbsia sp. KACC 23696 TaxID=3149231 RepID=UPI00325B26F7
MYNGNTFHCILFAGGEALIQGASATGPNYFTTGQRAVVETPKSRRDVTLVGKIL